MTRREFAPKLFISEPTLERWERGVGDPKEIHLHVLRRMREHMSGGQSMAYFEYDSTSDVNTAKFLYQEKQLIIETLKTMAVILMQEENSDDDDSWQLSFDLGWGTSESMDLMLTCEGSDNARRPFIDFNLEITLNWEQICMPPDAFQKICFNHGVSWELVQRKKRRSTMVLRHRIIHGGCSPDVVKHVLGNFQSCWNRVKRSTVCSQSGRSNQLPESQRSEALTE